MRTPLYLAVSSLLALAACGGGSSSTPATSTPSPTPVNGTNPPTDNTEPTAPETRLLVLQSGGDANGSGQLKIRLTDAPNRQIDVAEVTITDVSAHSPGGAPYSVLSEPRTLNLLDFQNGVSTLLGDIDLAAGRYTQIRLEVSDGWVESEGEGFAVFVPSGVVRLNRPFDVCTDGEVEILLDFDAEKSLHYNPGLNQFRLQPVVKVASVSEDCPADPGDGSEEEADEYDGATGWLSFVLPPIETELFDSLVTRIDDIRVHMPGIGQVSVLVEAYEINLLEEERQVAGDIAEDAGYTLFLPPVEVPSGALSQVRLQLQPIIVTDTEGRTITLQLPREADSEGDGLKFFDAIEVCEGKLTTVQWNPGLNDLDFESSDPVIALHPVADNLKILASCEPMEDVVE